MDALIGWIGQLYAGLGYPEIVFLMALESSLFPVPSELVMIPAGYLASTGALNPVASVATGAAGSMLGASANYLLGKYLGRALLLRYGRYLLIDEAKYHEAEGMFLKNALVATFVGRLLPVVRHLVSLPAGVFTMGWRPFLLMTALGSALWCSVLVALGYFFGESAVQVVRAYTHEAAIVIVIALAAFAAWFLLHGRRAGERRA